MHWTLPKDDSQANATQTKITTFFPPPRVKPLLVQLSLTAFFPLTSACRQTINYGYRGTKRKRSDR